MSNLLKSHSEISERVAKKRERLAHWLKDEIYTDYTTASGVLKCTPSAAYKALKAMERDELVESHEVGRVTMWALTIRGQIEYLRDCDDPAALFDTRISEVTVRHTLAVQRVRLAAEEAGGRDWKSEREIRRIAAQKKESGSQWIKVPDGVLTLDGKRVAVEVERTPKTPKRYYAIMADYLQMRKAKTVDAVHYVCETEKLATGLQRIFRNCESIVVKGTAVPLKPEHHEFFSFFYVKNWPKVR